LPPGASAVNDKYGTELRFEVGLISGHSYRIQVIAHDGDQNKGGDSGEACATFCAGTGMLCDPGVTECVENPDGASLSHRHILRAGLLFADRPVAHRECVPPDT